MVQYVVTQKVPLLWFLPQCVVKAKHIYIGDLLRSANPFPLLFFQRLLIGPKSIISLVISNTFSFAFCFAFYLRKCLTTEATRRRTGLPLMYVLRFFQYVGTDSSQSCSAIGVLKPTMRQVILLTTTLSAFPQQENWTGPRVLHRREGPNFQAVSSNKITRPRCTATSSLMTFRINLSTHLAVIPALLWVSQCQCLATTCCTTASLKRSSHVVKWPFLPRTSASTRKMQSIDNRRLLRGLPSSLGSEEWPRSTASGILFLRPLRRSRNRLGGAGEGTRIVSGLRRHRRRPLVRLSPVARGARSLRVLKLW